MPTPTLQERVVEAFWEYESYAGYAGAMRMTTRKFDLPQHVVERWLNEDDEANSGNFITGETDVSSTLCIRKTPEPATQYDWDFKLPVKGIIARKFYGHDGTLGGALLTVGPRDLGWFEGVRAAGNFEGRDANQLDEIIDVLRDGKTIDMWFEV